jgi:predicted lipoprotein with Yx(FWY)xxD motif
MRTERPARWRLAGVFGAGAAALVLAACGSSSSSSSSSVPASGSSASGSSLYGGSSVSGGSSGSAASVALRTAKGPDGTYLVGPNGRALYLWVADTSGKSVCAGECAKAWPPLISKAMPSAAGGVDASDLGLVSRAGGTKQVTYKGHPLYYFAGDTAAGSTTGQGSPQFGAKWWLVAPSGSPITSSGSSGGSSAGASSSSSHSGGWG